MSTPPISVTEKFIVGPSVVDRELQGEVVILNLESGTYFGLDPVGTRMWMLIREGLSLQSVIDRLLEEYDVSADTLARDVLALASQLLDKGLIERARDGAGRDTP